MTHREPLKPLLRVGRTSGRGFQGGCGCSVQVGSRTASCWFWLPHLAQDPRTGGLALGWACTWDTGGPRVSLVHSEVESKAGCSPPVPGTGCRMHAGMQLAGQINPAWGSWLRALSSKKQQEITTVIYSSLATQISTILPCHFQESLFFTYHLWSHHLHEAHPDYLSTE